MVLPLMVLPLTLSPLTLLPLTVFPPGHTNSPMISEFGPNRSRPMRIAIIPQGISNPIRRLLAGPSDGPGLFSGEYSTAVGTVSSPLTQFGLGPPYYPVEYSPTTRWPNAR